MVLLWQIVQFVLVLSFLVVIHELGHYLVARWRKVRVEEFGLGYPPRATKLFQWKETVFTLNWIPFGGFVRLDGEEGPDRSGQASASPLPNAGWSPFYAKGKWSRLSIILAGAAVNFLFGILAFSLYFSIKGLPELSPQPRIGEVAAGSPAAQAGVPTNVQIIGFRRAGQHTAVTTTDQVITYIAAHEGQTITVQTTGPCQAEVCPESLQEYTVAVRTKAETPANQGLLGVRFQPVVIARFYPWYEMPFRGAWFGTQQALFLSRLIVSSLGQIMWQSTQGRMPQEIAGPVGIFSQARTAGLFSNGWLELINFAGLLSINLAIMNVLPIPALDGGRALFLLIESLIGQKRLSKVEGYVNYAAFGLLLALTILITVKDIHTLVIQ